jgi:hypothetical protein
VIEPGVVAVLRLSSQKKVLELRWPPRRGYRSARSDVHGTGREPGAGGARRADGEGWVVGVVNVLDGETARVGLLSGADFVVGPPLVAGVVGAALCYGALAVPGAVDPTGVQRCLEARMGGEMR